MSQWQVGKVKKYLTYKLKAEGIMLHKREERYTSQTCPVCGAKKNVRGAAIPNIGTFTVRRIYCPKCCMKTGFSPCRLKFRNPRIYGSPKREVVDGLFRLFWDNIF
ncbi:zinc ribbon domain-containing protein [Aneurinibacillus thermoaerophilus]|uniref:zinc ribbon domain-containing protein n=1 Tax=Aneurinibacillus thermoaerophilus TaxID=143495 RepID=UPI0038D18867